MEYRALYRKYRPQRFADVVGQDHVTRTLAREVVDGKVAHAYLFAGPRGTGKTTTARLLAKALNCERRRANGEPCNECVSCVAITEGTSLDVVELDAASHNKVEDIREMRVNVGTVAVAGGARRVYILDEAHMLSRAAGNALLKTLEEPPEHVVFVLATTEPYKLLDTIRSRAQRFDFHPVALEVVAAHLRRVGDLEGFTIEESALGVIAAHAAGSVRDGLSLLEQVAALGGGTVEEAAVTRALGLADRDAFATLARAIVDRDAPAALGLVAELAARGVDLRRFVSDALGFLRGVFLAHYAPNLEEVADEPKETLDDWRVHAAALPAGDVLRAIDELSEALAQLRQGREERLVVELAMLRLVRPDTSHDVPAVASRVDRLEARVRELANQVALGAVPAPELPSSSPAGTAESSLAEPVTFETPATDAPVEPQEPSDSEDTGAEEVTIDLGAFAEIWPRLVARVREEAGPRRHALLKEARPADVRDRVVVLEVPSHLPFHLEQLRADVELQGAVVAMVRQTLGAAVELSFVAADDDGAAPEEETPVPDRDTLLEEGADGTDPTALVVDILGGEIVSD